MAPRARKLDKSVHSESQIAFCELMIKARKTAGLTQRDLANVFVGRNRLSPNTKAAKGGSMSWNLLRFVRQSKQAPISC
jgi:hypothetical protein